MLRFRPLVCLAAAAVAGVSACSSSSHRRSPRPASSAAHGTTNTTSTNASTTSTARASTTTAKAIDPDATQTLRAHMVDSVAGYTLQPAGQTATGPSSLAAAANDQGGAGELGPLGADGYRAGYELLFSSGDRQILELAYRFATAAGAQRYADRAFAARVHDGGTPASTAPAGIPGARGVERSESDAASALVVFTRGPTLVILSTIQPPGTNAAALIDPIAAAQYARLANY